MKNMMLFFRISLKRSKISFLFSIIIGLLLCMMLSTMGENFNENFKFMKVAVCDKDESRLSKSFLMYLKDCAKVDVSVIDDYDKASEDLINRDISAIIEIPEGFEEECIAAKEAGKLPISTIQNYANKEFLKQYVNSYYNSVSMLAKSADGNETTFHEMLEKMDADSFKPEIVKAEDNLVKKSVDGVGFELSTGFYVNFSLFLGLILSFLIIEDRLDGVFNRISVMPICSTHYVLGSGLFVFLLGFLSNGIFFLYILLTKKEIGMPIGLAFLFYMLFVLIVIGVSTTLAFLIKSKIGLVFSLYGIGCISTLLGGAYFDTSYAPELMQQVAKVVPQYWFLDCVRGFQKSGDYNYTLSVTIVSLFAVLFLLLAAVVFYRKSSFASK